jgi:hypothetical protein
MPRVLATAGDGLGTPNTLIDARWLARLQHTASQVDLTAATYPYPAHFPGRAAETREYRRTPGEPGLIESRCVAGI